MKARYVNSPSHRKDQRDSAVRVFWICLGMVILALALWAGFFDLEGGLPLQDI